MVRTGSSGGWRGGELAGGEEPFQQLWRWGGVPRPGWCSAGTAQQGPDAQVILQAQLCCMPQCLKISCHLLPAWPSVMESGLDVCLQAIPDIWGAVG